MSEINKNQVKEEVKEELKRNIYDEDAVIAPYKELNIDDISDHIAANIYTAFNKEADDESSEKTKQQIRQDGWDTIRAYIHELNDHSDIFAPYKELNIDDISDNVAAKIYTAFNKEKE